MHLAYTCSRLVLPALAALFAACSNQPRIELVNACGAPLSQVVVSGNGFRHEVGDMPTGAVASFAVSPAGDTGLALECLRSGERLARPADGYFGKGPWDVRAEVGADGAWKVDARLR